MQVPELIVELIKRAQTNLPLSVEKAIDSAQRRETGPAKLQLTTILDNIEYARKNGIPMCQDTGIPIFFIGVGKGSYVTIDDIDKGVRKATQKIPLRANIVEPLTRENTKDNTGGSMPPVHVERTNEEYTEIKVLIKGAGSENMSALRMLKPHEGLEGIKRFVLETVVHAAGNPCPPTILGIGIGSTSDGAMLLAKKALLRQLGNKNNDPKVAALEKKLGKEINKLGIGPMGLGGRTTCLGVKIETGHCHTASLPVGINFQCWADRKAGVRIYKNRMKWLRL